MAMIFFVCFVGALLLSVVIWVAEALYAGYKWCKNRTAIRASMAAAKLDDQSVAAVMKSQTESQLELLVFRMTGLEEFDCERDDFVSAYFAKQRGQSNL